MVIPTNDLTEALAIGQIFGFENLVALLDSDAIRFSRMDRPIAMCSGIGLEAISIAHPINGVNVPHPFCMPTDDLILGIARQAGEPAIEKQLVDSLQRATTTFHGKDFIEPLTAVTNQITEALLADYGKPKTSAAIIADMKENQVRVYGGKSIGVKSGDHPQLMLQIANAILEELIAAGHGCVATESHNPIIAVRLGGDLMKSENIELASAMRLNVMEDIPNLASDMMKLSPEERRQKTQRLILTRASSKIEGLRRNVLEATSAEDAKNEFLVLVNEETWLGKRLGKILSRDKRSVMTSGISLFDPVLGVIAKLADAFALDGFLRPTKRVYYSKFSDVAADCVRESDVGKTP